MSWGFEEGRVYSRRADVHAQFGGQQQGGIITPAQHPLVIIITGEEGLTHGYADRTREDGAFEYFGEGQIGDMVLQRGNLAIASHSAEGKSLLLFRKTSEGLRFVGEMVYEAHHLEKAPDREGNQRSAIVFELRALAAVVEGTEETAAAKPQAALEELRSLARAAATVSQMPATANGRNVYQRSQDVRNYVLARARGGCEGCRAPAPFARKDGSPYLEPHHIRRLSDGGPDDPSYVIALCPNCHRRVHAGADGEAYNSSLLLEMKTIEPTLPQAGHFQPPSAPAKTKLNQ
ncbi:HNH endonuclease signature motif containing protein [Bradyrhizobium sp. 169]|uniref:HNH endonuclease n=1 Tax=Bradyrhizobium sp. 169 TaxID=2782640 RepID=UPI001FFAA049|nr:HNH endonuclease signature motif containing protein [Bradyrhizobium sp. 169]MCK1586936.1 HNH endonuclease [Bradyrhizobium sp. 169]